MKYIEVFHAALPALSAVYPVQIIKQWDTFYRVGALVFGGGHVVLPLLKAEVVANRWVTDELFMAGYGVVTLLGRTEA